MRWFQLVVVVTLLLVASAVEAIHEVDHRYVVLGYVRDEAGAVVVGSPVEVVREKTGSSARAETDEEGFYLAIVHLHNEDLGDTLRVAAGAGTIEIQARFDPRDVTTHRGTRVDFRGRRAVERQEMFLETLRAFLE